MSRKFACTLGIGIGSILTLLATHYISDVNQLVEVQPCPQFSLPPQSLPEPQTETQNKKPSEEPSEKCKKDENGEEADQKVEKRKDCPEEGFNEENLIKLNSDPLPIDKWSYEELCKENDGKNCVSEFVKIDKKSNFYLSRKTKNANCMVRKSMSTVFKYISCFLDDPLKFLATQNNLLNYAKKNDCDEYYTKSYNAIDKIQKERNATVENGWQYTMIVRDPIERFLSGYLHLCYYGYISTCEHWCNGCGLNMTCFLEKELENVKKVAASGELRDVKTSHLIPQSWQCELRDHFNKFHFIRYYSNSTELVEKELTPYLQSRNVSIDLTNYLERRMTSERTMHSTSTSNVKPFLMERILRSPYILKLLMKLFYNDYKLFGLELPKLPF